MIDFVLFWNWNRPHARMLDAADPEAIDDKTTSCGNKFMVMILSRGLPQEEYSPVLQHFKSSSYV
jgi:hypothetical protein